MLSAKSNILLLMAGFAVLASIPFIVPHTGALILVAFVPLLCMNAMIRKNAIRHPFVWYYSAFLIFNVITTFWVSFATVPGAIAAMLLNALQMAAVFAIYRWSERIFGEVKALFVLAITWTAWEHVYFIVEISWPWLCLGNALAVSPELAQWYEIFGSVGGSFWILMSNILIFLALKTDKGKSRKCLAGIATAVIIIPIICSIVRYSTYKETGDTVEVVAIQPNIDPYAKFGVTPQSDIDDLLLSEAESLITPETKYIVTPETYTFNVNIDEPFNNGSIWKYKRYLESHPDTELILGVVSYRNYTSTLKPSVSARKGAGSRNWYDTFNTAIIMDHNEVHGHYFKSKLVPGAEMIPYQKYLSFIGPLFDSLGGGSFSYGKQDDMEPIDDGDGHKVACVICYESVYGEYCRRAMKKGAEFIAVMTNDGWWRDTPGYKQHFRYARLRAIETRKDLIFAANNGRSGYINQRGDDVITTPWWEKASFRTDIHTNNKNTPFTMYGDLVGKICGYLFLIIFAAMILKGIFSLKGRRS